MTSDEIRAFIAGFLDAWQHENLPRILDCYAANARIESPMFHTVHGRAEIQKSFASLFGAFDAWEFHVDDIVIDREPQDRAVVVYRALVTHRGDLFGMPGTGRRVDSSGVLILRFENGLISSDRRLYDFTGLLVQLGVLKAKAV